MSSDLYPMRVDLDGVRARGLSVSRYLAGTDYRSLPVVVALHLSGDVGAMMQEIEYLRAQLSDLRGRRVDPALLRWCDWPGCWRSYDATTGPVGESGWMAHRHPAVLLCPDHDQVGHRPTFVWTPGDGHITAMCECGASAQVCPSNHQTVIDWWSAHVAPPSREG